MALYCPFGDIALASAYGEGAYEGLTISSLFTRLTPLTDLTLRSIYLESSFVGTFPVRVTTRLFVSTFTNLPLVERLLSFMSASFTRLVICQSVSSSFMLLLLL